MVRADTLRTRPVSPWPGRVFRLLPGLALIYVAGAVRAQTGEELSPQERARSQYTTGITSIQSAATEARETAFTKYGNTLEHLATTYQKRGHLDALLAVKEETKRFGRDADLPEESAPGLPILLQKTQAQARAALAEADRKKANSIVKLTGDYIAHLKTLKRRLTTQGKLDEAVAIRDEIEKARKAPVYTAAQFEKAALDLSDSEENSAKRNPPSPEPETTRKSTWRWSWGTRMGKYTTRGLETDGKAKITRSGMVLKGGRIVAEGLGETIHSQIGQANAITLEAAFRTDSLRQSGPARIVSCSLNGNVRNVSLCQERNRLVFRLRTPNTGRNGTSPEVFLGEISQEKTHHVTVSYRPGELVCVLDGEVRRIKQISGDFSNWEKFPLVFGNEARDKRPWYGTITHVSIENVFTGADDAVKRFGMLKRNMR